MRIPVEGLGSRSKTHLMDLAFGLKIGPKLTDWLLILGGVFS